MRIGKVNIGLLIEQRINELGITKSEFARRSGIANQNINRVLNRTSIDTDKLIAISEALDYNFFNEYTGQSASDQRAITVSGNNNQLNEAGAHNNFNMAAPAHDDALLSERVKSLEALLAEKERLIKVLMETRK